MNIHQNSIIDFICHHGYVLNVDYRLMDRSTYQYGEYSYCGLTGFGDCCVTTSIVLTKLLTDRELIKEHLVNDIFRERDEFVPGRLIVMSVDADFGFHVFTILMKEDNIWMIQSYGQQYEIRCEQYPNIEINLYLLKRIQEGDTGAFAVLFHTEINTLNNERMFVTVHNYCSPTLDSLYQLLSSAGQKLEQMDEQLSDQTTDRSFDQWSPNQLYEQLTIEFEGCRRDFSQQEINQLETYNAVKIKSRVQIPLWELNEIYD